MKILDFPEFRQTYDYDCGAKAIEAVLAYYGTDLREDKILKIASTKKTGTSTKGIIKTLKKYGLACVSGKMTVDELKKFIDKKIPVIVPLQAWSGRRGTDWKNNWSDGHYAVVIGYDSDRVYFEDPNAIFRTYLDFGEFETRWHDTGENGKKYLHFGIAVSGKRKKIDLKKFIHMD